MHFSALRHLSPEASFAVRNVYSMALRHVWILLIPFAAVGWGLCFLMKELEMHDEVDERFAADVLQDDREVYDDREKGLIVTPGKEGVVERQGADSSWERGAGDESSIEPASSMKLLTINQNSSTTNDHS